MICLSAGVWAQTLADSKCISMMEIPLEGPDSVFLPAFKEAGFVLRQQESDKQQNGDALQSSGVLSSGAQSSGLHQESDTYYLEGDFYGIKSTIALTVNEKTRLLSEAMVTCGPYRTRDLYERNQKYLLGKLQREWGNFKAKGDGSLYMLNAYGYIRQSTPLDDEGRRSIHYYYLNTVPYFKDAANMGLKGCVQEVITENPVAENDILHFSETGVLESDDLIDREYNAAGYIVRAAMREKSGGKSQLKYEYDDDNCLVRRTLVNATSGIRSVNDYKYNGSLEITQQSQKVFNADGECVLSITMKNDLSERDDYDNWTHNKMQLTYWEKGQRTQIITVNQTRTLSYWE